MYGAKTSDFYLTSRLCPARRVSSIYRGMPYNNFTTLPEGIFLGLTSLEIL